MPNAFQNFLRQNGFPQVSSFTVTLVLCVYIVFVSAAHKYIFPLFLQESEKLLPSSTFTGTHRWSEDFWLILRLFLAFLLCLLPRETKKRRKISSLFSHLLTQLPLVLLSFFLQVLSLFFRTHSLQFNVPLSLLPLRLLQSSILCFLLTIHFLQLLNFLLTGGFNLSCYFRAESST